MKFKFLSESNELPFQGSFSVWISTDSTGQSLLPRAITNSWYYLPSFLYSFVHLYKSFHIYIYICTNIYTHITIYTCTYTHIACTKCISFEYVLNIFIPFCYLPFYFIFPISWKYLKFYEVKPVSFFLWGL